MLSDTFKKLGGLLSRGLPYKQPEPRIVINVTTPASITAEDVAAEIAWQLRHR